MHKESHAWSCLASLMCFSLSSGHHGCGEQAFILLSLSYHQQGWSSSCLFKKTLVLWAAFFDPKHDSINRNKNSDVSLGSKESFVVGIYVFPYKLPMGFMSSLKWQESVFLSPMPAENPLSLVKILCLPAAYFLDSHLLCHPDFS